MTVNHGVLGSSPCSGAMREGCVRFFTKCKGVGTGNDTCNENEKFFKKVWSFQKKSYLCSPKPFLWELSSAGLEHLPYKQRVGGSNPSAPTRRKRLIFNRFFCCIWACEQAPAHPQKNGRCNRNSRLFCVRLITPQQGSQPQPPQPPRPRAGWRALRRSAQPRTPEPRSGR